MFVEKIFLFSIYRKMAKFIRKVVVIMQFTLKKQTGTVFIGTEVLLMEQGVQNTHGQDAEAEISKNIKCIDKIVF